MSRVLVNIRGCNGAGKSTIPMSMKDDPEMRIVGFKKNAHGRLVKPYLTVFPTYGWVALGTYENKTGGMDTISTNDDMKEALAYAWRKYPQYDVLMEGVIASTIRSTYIDLFKEYEHVHGANVIVINLLPPPEVCIARVQERNGGKPVKDDLIMSKWKTVNKNVEHFRDAGLTTLRVNNENTPKDEMLKRFLRLVDKYREG